MTWIGIPLLAFALVSLADSSKAEAGGGFSLRIGSFGIGSHGHHFRSPSYHFRSPSYHFRSPSYHYRTPTYHYRTPTHSRFHRGHSLHHPRRPHLDYFPPKVVPHGNHYDYIPGHYHLHHGDHYDW